MINTKLAVRILGQIEAHPESHDQKHFLAPCGTQMCIAGWACFLSGDIIGRENRGKYREVYFLRDRYGDCIEERAKLLLQLSDREAQKLFLEMDNDSALEYLRWLIMNPESIGRD